MGGRRGISTRVEDQAPNFGISEEIEARFARRPLEGQDAGTQPVPARYPTSGSRSATSTSGRKRSTWSRSGSARIKVEDEIVELGQWDTIGIDKDTMRDIEAGPDGVEYLAFGAGDDPTEVEITQGWWTD